VLGPSALSPLPGEGETERVDVQRRASSILWQCPHLGGPLVDRPAKSRRTGTRCDGRPCFAPGPRIETRFAQTTIRGSATLLRCPSQKGVPVRDVTSRKARTHERRPSGSSSIPVNRSHTQSSGHSHIRWRKDDARVVPTSTGSVSPDDGLNLVGARVLRSGSRQTVSLPTRDVRTQGVGGAEAVEKDGGGLGLAVDS
jgi:hypothetical protein